MEKEISLQEQKKIEIEILDYLDTICQKHSIQYFLAAGTLLGAIRHKGFIPWDDDIDVILLRDDYEKLIKVLENEKSKYKLLSRNTNSQYFYLFSKLVDSDTCLIESDVPQIPEYGIYIDIFPLDYLPNNYTKRRREQRKILILRRFWGAAITTKMKDSISKKIMKRIAHILGWRFFRDLLDRECKKINQTKTNYVECVVAADNPYRNVKREWFNTSINATFEGKQYPVPSRYDEYLTELFNDYMSLPPEEQQVTHHSFVAYYKEKGGVK